MLKLTEIQSHCVSHLVSVGNSTTWSEDGHVALVTDKGLQIVSTTAATCDSRISRHKKLPHASVAMMMMVLILFAAAAPLATASDITDKVFKSATNGMPAAFGDFDSDKFTDLFVLKDDARTVEILLGSDTEPLLRPGENLQCKFSSEHIITSVVPGDFDGDALMDVLVTVFTKSIERSSTVLDVYVLWGNIDRLDCNITKPFFSITDQPLAMDWNQDMVIDLFSLDKDGNRVFWIFNKNRTKPEQRRMKYPHEYNEGRGAKKLRRPHSHAFLDLNQDSYGDLYLSLENGGFEVWLYSEEARDFVFSHEIGLPPGVLPDKGHYVGQTVFQDMALEGRIDQLIPVCFTNPCTNSMIYLRSNGTWHSIKVNLNDWQFVHPHDTRRGSPLYLNTLTLRAGDFNMDGFPDLLATLVSTRGTYQTFLLENVECTTGHCDGFPRTFEVQWNALHPYNNNTVLGVFYDFLQDGILDVILVHDGPPKMYVSAFRNSLDYDANFVKVMVLTGLRNKDRPAEEGPLGKKQRTYGTNLPGPTILYHTMTQEGNPRAAISTQLPQSAHFSLMLPYIIFGLGRTPNFVDSLKVGVYGHSRTWTQLIPNSQVVVIPWPPEEPTRWKVQLFVTPSKLILQSVFALLGTCLLLSLIIGGLYWKERREDHREKLQEAHKFHFDAM